MSQTRSNTVGIDGVANDSMTRENCRICENIIGGGVEADAIWNEILFDSEDFVSTPSVGALVPGYLLTIPKQHTICSGALRKRDLGRYWKFTKKVRERVEQKFGKTILFEHGPARSDTEVGCGVDHAHLHIVPIDGPILDLVEKNNPAPIEWREIKSFKMVSEIHNSGEEYLFYQGEGKTMFVGTSEQINSQLFRRAIAELTDSSDQFDWSENPMVNNVHATVEELNMAVPSTENGVAD